MSTTIHYYVLNAFNTKAFSGNRAAVALLDQATKEKIESGSLYQAIAGEINAPATAFVIPQSGSIYEISWYHAMGAINLCGHATLATSKILFDRIREASKDDVKDLVIKYVSTAGPLQAKQTSDGRVELEFPAATLAPLSDSFGEEQVKEIISIVQETFQGDSLKVLELQRGTGKTFDNWLLVEVDLSNSSANSLKDIKVNQEAVLKLESYGIQRYSVTTRGSLPISQRSGASGEYHIVSRLFAPALGYEEDAVTGSMHCLLAPYWTTKLQKTDELGAEEVALKAWQASAREGELEVVWKEQSDTVLIRGDAIVTGKGETMF